MSSASLTSHKLVVNHILKHLGAHRSRYLQVGNSAGTHQRTWLPPPLFVGFQAPQGAGKTTLTSKISQILSEPPHSLGVVIFSLDDLYRTHDELLNISETHPGNGLLRGRGQPGTHDVELGEKILKGLLDVNNPDAPPVKIPFFDKSLFDGEGDRSEDEGMVINGPVDVVVLEGWSMGFYPLTDDEELMRRYNVVTTAPNPPRYTVDVKSIVQKHPIEHVKTINDYLKPYAEKLYPFFTVFITLSTPIQDPYGPIYKWRLQQEHHMKSLNGGRGMQDEEVRAFVDRYIPGYVFFSEGITQGFRTIVNPPAGVNPEGGWAIEYDPAIHDTPPWQSGILKINIDENREVFSHEVNGRIDPDDDPPNRPISSPNGANIYPLASD